MPPIELICVLTSWYITGAFIFLVLSVSWFTVSGKRENPTDRDILSSVGVSVLWPIVFVVMLFGGVSVLQAPFDPPPKPK